MTHALSEYLTLMLCQLCISLKFDIQTSPPILIGADRPTARGNRSYPQRVGRLALYGYRSNNLIPLSCLGIPHLTKEASLARAEGFFPRTQNQQLGDVQLSGFGFAVALGFLLCLCYQQTPPIKYLGLAVPAPDTRRPVSGPGRVSISKRWLVEAHTA